MSQPLLSIRNLSVRYESKENTVYAVDDVSLDIERGEVVALVGESGSGKTSVALAIPKLLQSRGQITTGEVLLEGTNLLQLDEKRLRTVRGRQVSVIFQHPVAGLNPVLSVEEQVSEAILSHIPMKKREARERVVEILATVGLPEPQRVAKSYPFQLSGGMCQRVMIGIAMALNPQLLIADEPTSALDTTIQAQILDQLERLRQANGTAILLITHDFGVVARSADRVAVMYGGKLVETGTAEQILRLPRHPYTAALLASLPRVDIEQGALPSIPGRAPEMLERVEHCPFLDRCPKALMVCRTDAPPPLAMDEDGRAFACYNPMWVPPGD